MTRPPAVRCGHDGGTPPQRSRGGQARGPLPPTLDVAVAAATVDAADAGDEWFAGAVLWRVEFRSCRMSGVTFAGARLRDVAFGGCKLDGASFAGSEGERVLASGCVLSEADFGAARWSSVQLLSCELGRARFEGSSLARPRLHGSVLEGLIGVEALRGAVIDADQALVFARLLLDAHEVVVDDGDAQPQP